MVKNYSALSALYSRFLLEQETALAREAHAVLREPWRARIREDIPGLRAFVSELGFAGAPRHVSQIERLLEWPALRADRLRDEFLKLRGSIEDQLATRSFLFVSPDRVGLYENPLVGWGRAPERFRGIKAEIEEAGKCLALGRPTASVFHSMRVAELGLRGLAKRLGVATVKNKPVDYAQWREILEAVKKQIDALQNQSAGASKDKRHAYYSEIYLELRAFKDAWRNHVVHARQRYSFEKAAEVFGHVRALMAKLAARAP